MAKTRKRSKRLLFLFSIILFFILIWLFLSYNVNPVIRKVSEEKVRALSTVAVNEATGTVIRETASDYENIITIIQNNAGEIEMMQVNSLLLNLISRRVASSSQDNISELGAQGISVPLGSLSGLTFLAGRGPDVKIKVYPVGAVNIKFDSEFFAAGINQTKHRITLIVTAYISVIIPGSNRTVTTQTEITLCENIIVGKVPDTYLNSQRLNEMLNLIP